MPRRLWPIDWAVEPHDDCGATDDDSPSEDDHGASDHDGGAHHNGRRLLHRVGAHRVPREAELAAGGGGGGLKAEGELEDAQQADH